MNSPSGVPGIERFVGVSPTLDTARVLPTHVSRWEANRLSLFGHSISVDLGTGNLTVNTQDVVFPYYEIGLGVSRYYDAQQQWLRNEFIRHHPNVDPKIQVFGNWRTSFEADADDAWLDTLAELHFTCDVGIDALLERVLPDFPGLTVAANATQDILTAYGVPRCMLDAIAWVPPTESYLLRTKRGPFVIAAGGFRAGTLVDPAYADLCIIDPIRCRAFHLSSKLFYDVVQGGTRYRGIPLVVDRVSDALGHLTTVDAADAMPYRKLLLQDGSGRVIALHLDHPNLYVDGLIAPRPASVGMATRVVDQNATAPREWHYDYDAAGRLTKVTYPTTRGTKFVKYRYDLPAFPGALSAIENSSGASVQFEYELDPDDVDLNLEPRLKVTRIVEPEGGVFEFEYKQREATTVATVRGPDGGESRQSSKFLVDADDSRRRYQAVEETIVEHGYLLDETGEFVARSAAARQLVRTETTYSTDRRFNIERFRDPVGRLISYTYNDFQQIRTITDPEAHVTEYEYDVDAVPRHYDLRRIVFANNVRIVDDFGVIQDNVQNIVLAFTWKRHDAFTTAVALDYAQSTHRLETHTDESGNVWTFDYDDGGAHLSISPTLQTSPLGIQTSRTFDNRGALKSSVDAVGNAQHYEYYHTGELLRYEGANGEELKRQCDPVDGLLDDYVDVNGGKTILRRDHEGQITSVLDPAGDEIHYGYYRNDRLRRITRHRPAVPLDALNGASLSLITPSADVPTLFEYTCLGDLCSLTNPLSLQYRFIRDELGRCVDIIQMGATQPAMSMAFDAASRPLARRDAAGRVTRFEYQVPAGFLQRTIEPPWANGSVVIPGKTVECQKFDYLGRALEIVDSEAGVTQRLFDAAGRLLLRSDATGHEMWFEYDEDGRLWHERDASGDYDILLELDDAGRARVIHDSDALDGPMAWVSEYTDDVSVPPRVGRLFQRTNHGIGLEEEFDYDKRGDVTTVLARWLGGETILAETAQYREDGMLRSLAGYRNAEFRYDALKQLVLETDSGYVSDYDLAGNRLWRRKLGTIGPGARDWHDVLNRLRKTDKIVDDPLVPDDFTYDAAGNLVTSTFPTPGSLLCFDSADRLRRFEDAGHAVNYSYDFDGKLTKKETTSKTTGIVTVLEFHYLLARPVLVYRDGIPLLLFTWDRSGRLLRARRYEPWLSSGTHTHSRFALYDCTGSPSVLVDEARMVHADRKYDAWGNSPAIGDASVLDIIGFKGALADEPSGLLLFGRRWYAAQLARWTSPDPSISNVAGVLARDRDAQNLYAYALNSPLSFTDPTGLQAEENDWIESGAAATSDFLVNMAGRASDIAAMTADAVKQFPTPGKAALAATQLIVGAIGFMPDDLSGPARYIGPVANHLGLLLSLGELASGVLTVPAALSLGVDLLQVAGFWADEPPPNAFIQGRGVHLSTQELEHARMVNNAYLTHGGIRGPIFIPGDAH